MSADKNLFSTALFRWAVCVPIALYFGLSAIIWVADDQFWSWNFSAEGFNNYLKIYRLPLGLLATILPLVAVVASNHRSIQSAATLKAQLSQNKLSNYYTHITEFVKFCESRLGYGGKNSEMLIDFEPRYAHNQLFPNAREGDYSINIALELHMEFFRNATTSFMTYIRETDFEQFRTVENRLRATKKVDELAAMEHLRNTRGDILQELIDATNSINAFLSPRNLELNIALNELLYKAQLVAISISRLSEFDTSPLASYYCNEFRDLSNDVAKLTKAASEADYKMTAPLS